MYKSPTKFPTVRPCTRQWMTIVSLWYWRFFFCHSGLMLEHISDDKVHFKLMNVVHKIGRNICNVCIQLGGQSIWCQIFIFLWNRIWNFNLKCITILLSNQLYNIVNRNYVWCLHLNNKVNHGLFTLIIVE